MKKKFSFIIAIILLISNINLINAKNIKVSNDLSIDEYIEQQVEIMNNMLNENISSYSSDEVKNEFVKKYENIMTEINNYLAKELPKNYENFEEDELLELAKSLRDVFNKLDLKIANLGIDRYKDMNEYIENQIEVLNKMLDEKVSYYSSEKVKNEFIDRYHNIRIDIENYFSNLKPRMRLHFQYSELSDSLIDVFGEVDLKITGLQVNSIDMGEQFKSFLNNIIPNWVVKDFD